MVRAAAQVKAGKSLPYRVDTGVKADWVEQALAGLYRQFAVVGPDVTWALRRTTPCRTQPNRTVMKVAACQRYDRPRAGPT